MAWLPKGESVSHLQGCIYPTIRNPARVLASTDRCCDLNLRQMPSEANQGIVRETLEEILIDMEDKSFKTSEPIEDTW